MHLWYSLLSYHNFWIINFKLYTLTTCGKFFHLRSRFKQIKQSAAVCLPWKMCNRFFYPMAVCNRLEVEHTSIALLQWSIAAMKHCCRLAIILIFARFLCFKYSIWCRFKVSTESNRTLRIVEFMSQQKHIKFIRKMKTIDFKTHSCLNSKIFLATSL